MENNLNSNSDFLEWKNNGKTVVAESKIKWLFIRNYTIIALIFFTIYKIISKIFHLKFLDTLNENFMNTSLLVIEDITKFVDLLINGSYNIFICAIIISLCTPIYTFISSMLIFEKYKIKKENKKNIIKLISIIELIISLVLMFDISVAYINQEDICVNYKLSLQKVIDKYNSSNKQRIDDNIDNYLNKVHTTNVIQFLILLITNICCSVFCIYWQKKILEKNCLE